MTPDNADKIDVWALGICLHLLVLGFNPFQDQNYRAHVLHQLKQAQSNQQSGVRAACAVFGHGARFDALPDDLAALLDGMLQYDPTRRFTLDQVAARSGPGGRRGGRGYRRGAGRRGGPGRLALAHPAAAAVARSHALVPRRAGRPADGAGGGPGGVVPAAANEQAPIRAAWRIAAACPPPTTRKPRSRSLGGLGAADAAALPRVALAPRARRRAWSRRRRRWPVPMLKRMNARQ